MKIRKGQLNDLTELQNLFLNTISSVCISDYNEQQIEVWISAVENKKRWQEIMTKQLVLVAEDNETVIGFCTLDRGNYIDLLYVHKDFQRQRIAYKLYTEIEKAARQQGAFELTSDVSKTAVPFFEKLGFNIVKEQIVNKKGVELINYKMEKILP